MELLFAQEMAWFMRYVFQSQGYWWEYRSATYCAVSSNITTHCLSHPDAYCNAATCLVPLPLPCPKVSFLGQAFSGGTVTDFLHSHQALHSLFFHSCYLNAMASWIDKAAITTWHSLLFELISTFSSVFLMQVYKIYSSTKWYTTTMPLISFKICTWRCYLLFSIKEALPWKISCFMSSVHHA